MCRQQQQYGGKILEYGYCYGVICSEYSFLYFPHVADVSALSISIVSCFCCCVVYVFVVSKVWVESES